MYSHLRGKVALITGSTSGIGLGIAKVLSAAGVHITLNGFGDAHEIEVLRHTMSEEFGTKVLYDRADMKDSRQVIHTQHTRLNK